MLDEPIDSLKHVSDTAIWVAMYRALEHARPDALFKDPLAEFLAGDRGSNLLQSLPNARSGAWSVIARTVVFDEWIRMLIEHEHIDCVINLAAGLDTRPYRMQLPANLTWIEVDYAAAMQFKDHRLKEFKPTCQLTRLGCDMGNPQERNALMDKLKAVPQNRTLVLTEGLLVYLEEQDVVELVKAFTVLPKVHFWISDLNSPATVRALDKKWGNALAKAQSKFRFAPTQGPIFFNGLGWQTKISKTNLEAAREIHREQRYGFWERIGLWFSKVHRDRMRDPTKLVLFRRAKI